MTGYILLLEDRGGIEPVLSRALEHSLLSLVSCPSITAGKRKLIESQPVLILCAAAFANDSEAGFKLATELSNHESLSTIPLVLVSDQLSEDVIRRASAAGARSLIPWPLSADALQVRLRPLLGDQLGQPTPSAVRNETKPVAEELPTADVPIVPLAPSEDAHAAKFQLAQRLLAKVLHNLKTSALLDVVDLEDVPGVVVEITRSVCLASGATSDSKQLREAPSAAQKTPSGSSTIDFDAIFRRK